MIAWLGELARRLYYLVNRTRLERELREEMDAHRAMNAGRDPRFGNELRLREESADVWGWAWLDRLTQDVRFGARLLRRSPAFTLTAVLVLALGIGVNLAAFEVFDAIALSWLPVRTPETLVGLSARTPNSRSTAFSYPEYQFYSARSTSIAATFALVPGTVDLEGTPRTRAEFVSAAYFRDLGATPVAGRLFEPNDERPGSIPVVMLDESTWRSRFGGDPSMVGRSVRVNGRPFVVAGIAASSFTAFHGRVAVWIPVTQHAAAFPGSTLVDDWTGREIQFYARLRNGVSLGAAQSELSGLAAALQHERPADTKDSDWIELRPAGKFLQPDESSGAVIALVAALVMLVLVTACMNLGILVLARTLNRAREFGLRFSVGASRGRIVRQLMTEHLMLGLLGAAVACGVAAVATRWFAAVTGLPAGITPHLTSRSVVVAGACAVLSTFVFGMTPALQAIRAGMGPRLRLRNVLVGVQIAAASVLLIVSGLLVRGVSRVGRVDLGFDYQDTLLVDPDLSAHGVKPAAAYAYWGRLDARVRQIPGVVDAAVTTLAPFGNRISMNGNRTLFYEVSASYFSTLRIRLVRGRIFRDGETRVTVVSESVARREWPDVDPLGQKYGHATVIGIVADARTLRLGEAGAGECYRALDPTNAFGPATAVMIVRASGPPGAIAATVVAVARSEQNGLTPAARLLSDALEDTLAGPRRIVLVASCVGATALILAVTGLGGVVAYTVSQRRREIGIRLALGARPKHVVGAIARQFRMPLVCGAIGGSVLAAGVGTVLSSELFGVSRFDPLAHAGALLLFGVVAACASVPALRRALRMDPATTLRAE